MDAYPSRAAEPAKPLPAPTKEAPKAIEAPVYKLTAADRCDVRDCGSRAFIRVTLYAGRLYFCGHHGAKALTCFDPPPLEVLDERSHLVAMVTRQPSDGAFA